MHPRKRRSGRNSQLTTPRSMETSERPSQRQRTDNNNEDDTYVSEDNIDKEDIRGEEIEFSNNNHINIRFDEKMSIIRLLYYYQHRFQKEHVSGYVTDPGQR